MVAEPDLGSGAVRRGGSSPFIRTKSRKKNKMEIVTEDKGEQIREIKIILKPEDYKSKLQQGFKEKQRTISLPGFRKGNAPMEYVKKHYSRSLLYDGFHEMIFETLYKYLEENKIQPVGNPIPSEGNYNLTDNWSYDNDLEFVYEIGLAPIIDLDQEFEPVVNRYVVDVTDEWIDEEIADLQKQYSIYDRADDIQENDYVIGEFIELDENLEKKENGVVHKSGILIERLSDSDEKSKFIGLIQNEEVIFDLKKSIKNEAEISHLLMVKKEDIISLSSNFKFIVSSITRIYKPELGQEFFDKVFGSGEVNGEEEFREGLKHSLQSNFTQVTAAQLEYDLKKYLMSKLNLTLPDEFLKRSIKTSYDDKFTEEDIEKNYHHIAENMKWEFIQHAAAIKFGIKVMQDEYNAVGFQMFKEAMKDEKIPLTNETYEKYLKPFFDNKKNEKLIYEKVMQLKTNEALAKLLKVEVIALPLEVFYSKMTFQKEYEENN